MTGKATLAACEWIQANHPAEPAYMLSGNIDTDKKHSHDQHAADPRQAGGRRGGHHATRCSSELMGVDTRTLFRARQIRNVGAFMAGAAYNGAHAANGLAALFIATGQDVANVAESHAGITYTQLLDNGDYYWSVTLPSLIVATYGGGTGLATQRECLEMLGCYGAGQGATSSPRSAPGWCWRARSRSASRSSHGDWVSSHDRARPQPALTRGPYARPRAPTCPRPCGSAGQSAVGLYASRPRVS